MTEPLLTVEELETRIDTADRTITAVDKVSFSIEPGETVCLVGESGSGKTATCESITQIIPQPPATITGGTVQFAGQNLTEMTDRELRAIRGDQIAHIFQNPQRTLDPVYTIGDQIGEAIRIHQSVPDEEIRQRAIGLLRRVGIPDAERRVDEYPDAFSGGQQQRIAIAAALAADPDLLIADEPTTSVDVTVQARLIELFDELTDSGMAMLFVTHDLRVAAALADRVLVMFGGTIVERAPITQLLDTPAHPYTRALFDSYESFADDIETIARSTMPTDGCRFRNQCPYAVSACADGHQPAFHPLKTDAHQVSCVHYQTASQPEKALQEYPEDRV